MLLCCWYISISEKRNEIILVECVILVRIFIKLVTKNFGLLRSYNTIMVLTNFYLTSESYLDGVALNDMVNI